MSVSLIDGHIDDDTPRMTDNEIIKALECCMKDDCENCPYFANGLFECGEHFNEDVLDLINRQKAEIERLKAECGNQSALWSKHYENIFETAKETVKAEAVKAEAVKEFAERLKEMSEHFWEEKENFVSEDDIDNLVKEMVGD